MTIDDAVAHADFMKEKYGFDSIVYYVAGEDQWGRDGKFYVRRPLEIPPKDAEIVYKTFTYSETIPTFYGRDTKRFLLACYGLPNAAPRPGESLFETSRVMFVNDADGGKPICYWAPNNE